MAKSADDPRGFISHVSFIGRTESAFKTLRGFDKSRHTVPDGISSATTAFLVKLCAPELGEIAEDFFQRARTTFAYKRKDIALDLSPPVATLTTKDFTLEIAYTLGPEDAGTYTITRTLHTIRNGDLLQTAEADAVFSGQFSALSFSLKKGVRIDSVIDAVESLEDSALRVTYPSDCRHCVLHVADVNAEVMCDGATLEVRFPEDTTPRDLLEAFVAVRQSFALSKSKPLSGLL